jgi:hypothetical protein
MRKALLVLVAVAVVAAVGAEVPPPVAGGDTVLPGWLATVCSFDFVWKGLGALGAFLLAWIFKLAINKAKDDAAMQDAILAIQAGVTKTYHDFVQAAKEASEDGKLTPEEKKKAREMAIQAAKDLAMGPAKDLLLKWGKDKITALIEQYLAKYKDTKGTP